VESGERQALNAALIRLKRGDRTAAEEVFGLAWPLVRSFCARWLPGSPNAEDVAQQALVKLFEQVLNFDESRDAAGWLLELAVWECKSERARVRRRPMEGEDGAAVAAAAQGPEAEVERAELQAALGEVLSGLSPADQAELARLLADEAAGDPAARKRRQRALERLKSLWRTLHGE
jgi:RNA polymerase sigma-70 factor (ECF subfamily)